MTYFNVIACNAEECAVIRIYMKSKFNFLKEGMTYKFSDIIKKADNSYWAVGTSTIGYTGSLKTVNEVTLDLPENAPECGITRKILPAMRHSDKSVIRGKIVQVSPIKKRKNGTLSVRALSLKDQSGVGKVCLFEKLAEHPFQQNQVIQLTSLYSKNFNDVTQLTASTTTSLEFIQDEEMESITISEEDNLMDDDFREEADYSSRSLLEINVITEAVTYDCCSTNACRKKKLQNKKCPVCQEVDVEGKKGCRVVVEIQTIDTEEATECVKITMFNNMVFDIFQITEDDLGDSDNFICSLCEKLPIRLYGKLIQNRLYDFEIIKE